jgi:threonine synthase
MEQLNRDGFYTVSDELLAKIQDLFWAGYCDDAAAQGAISKVWTTHHYLCDPHTATGWQVAEDYVNQTGDTQPMVVLSTASAYKFPAAVLSAIGGEPGGDEFAQQETLEAITCVPMPKNLKGLKEKPALHTTVISKAFSGWIGRQRLNIVFKRLPALEIVFNFEFSPQEPDSTGKPRHDKISRFLGTLLLEHQD